MDEVPPLLLFVVAVIVLAVLAVSACACCRAINKKPSDEPMTDDAALAHGFLPLRTGPRAIMSRDSIYTIQPSASIDALQARMSGKSYQHHLPTVPEHDHPPSYNDIFERKLFGNDAQKHTTAKEPVS